MRAPNKTPALAQEWAVWSRTTWDLRLETLPARRGAIESLIRDSAVKPSDWFANCCVCAVLRSARTTTQTTPNNADLFLDWLNCPKHKRLPKLKSANGTSSTIIANVIKGWEKEYTWLAYDDENNAMFWQHIALFSFALRVVAVARYQHDWNPGTECVSRPESRSSAAAEAQKGLYLRSYPYRMYNKLRLVSF